MRKIAHIAFAALALSACAGTDKGFDATGTFEATEATISAEETGVLLHLDISEGDEVSAGQVVGQIDTTQLWLKLRQAAASKEVYLSQKQDVGQQTASLRQQLDKALREQKRQEELVADKAAPAKLLDDAQSAVAVLERQLEAQRSALSTTNRALDKQAAATDAQLAALAEMISRCRIKAPVGGTILDKYAEQGEFMTVGKPLFRIADTKTMFLRAYVTSAQLQQIRIGQAVKVFADYGDGNRQSYDGTLTWISNRSEFTPKTILTDDERADLVYAVKIAVRNDGFIKIGMYGEVLF